MGLATGGSAAAAYAVLAEHYDLLTRSYRHDLWVRRLESLARAHGLRGRTALDVACGTGKSLVPLAELGYDVTGCDLSPEMLDVARRAAPPDVELLEADMRALPPLGDFDLVTCLDDAVNYLLEEDELEAAAGSFADVLAPGGVLVFDLNARRAFADGFRSTFAVDDEDAFLCWCGHGEAEGGRARATVEIFARSEEDCWTRASSVHEQRYWPLETLADALAGAGLAIAAVYGQRRGAVIEPGLDEDRHTKAVVVARREVSANGHLRAVIRTPAAALELLARDVL
jgi:SAM-dependent methyltransferase